MEIPHSFSPNKAPESASYKKNRFPLNEEEPIKGVAATLRSRLNRKRQATRWQPEPTLELEPQRELNMPLRSR